MVSKLKLYLFWLIFWCLAPFLLRGLTWVKLCAWTQNQPKKFGTCPGLPLQPVSHNQSFQNYRPEPPENLMYYRIMEILNFNGILHEMLYGFRQGRSCEHALLKAKQVLLDSLSRRQVLLLLLIDFSKGFDMVEHYILLKKLEHYGKRDKASQWTNSYLQNRKQFVSIDGTDSKTLHMQYGVPQGSILGPLIFIIYINDIPNVLQIAKFILYADDANIFIKGNDITEVDEQLRDLCKILLKWVDSNGLRINLKKTKYMIFSRARNLELLSTLRITYLPIERLTKNTFLGVIFDENLTWSRHIKTIQTKIARYIGLMYKQLPLKVRIQMYHSYVQSHMNYISLVRGFSTKTNIESLFRAQKKGMRAVIPGFINYRYRSDGTLPGHLLSIQKVIVLNALVSMQGNFHLISHDQ